MNEKRIEEIKEKLKYYFGTPRSAPIKRPESPKEWEEITNMLAELEKIEKTPIITTDKYFLAVSKLAKNAVKLINQNGGSLVVDGRKNLSVHVSIGLYDDEITLPDHYSVYLDTIQMTVGSLIDCGAEYITAEQIYRTMTGTKPTDKVTPQAVGAVTKALRQLRNLWVTIDRSDEIKSYPKLKGLVSCIQEKSILPYDETITIKNQKGREMTAYKVEKLPPLYEYSKDRGEIRSIPAKILKISGLRSTPQAVCIKIWLIQQIESMKPSKNGKHRDNTIKYDTLFNDLKYDLSFSPSNPRKDKSKYISQIKKMLNHWINVGYIKGYKENRGKYNRIDSVTIFLKAK